jgi:preprotein translocase subunit SecD
VPIVVLAAVGVGLYLGLRGSSDGPWTEIVLEADPGGQPIVSTAMDQAVVIIQERLDKLGIAASEVERRGEWQISVRLHGIADVEQALEVIGTTAMLEFYDVAQFGAPYSTEAEALSTAGVAAADELPEGQTLVFWSAEKDNWSDQYFLVTTPARVTGAMLKGASLGYDANGRPKVDMEFDEEGAQAFAEVTGRLADMTAITGEGQQLAIVLDGNVESAPIVWERIDGGQAEITGNFTYDEANTLALVLQTGALPVALEVVSQSQPPAP